MMRKTEGWPNTDPYPFRNVELPKGEPPDCSFVARDKEYAKTVKVQELGDYAYILGSAWRYINELTRTIGELKEHIAWLKNVGGEDLNFACGIDIVCRGLAAKEGAIAEAEPSSHNGGEGLCSSPELLKKKKGS